LILGRSTNELENNDFQLLFNDDSICNALKCLPNLKFLDISYLGMLTNATLSEISNSCKKMKYLYLDGCNRIDQNGFEILRNLTNLAELSYKSRGDTCLSIYPYVNENSSVDKLSTFYIRSQKKTEDNDLLVLLSKCKNLVRLDISMCNQITNSIQLLTKFSNLLELHLEGCSNIPREIIEKVFIHCTNLIVIGLDGCNINDGTLKMLLEDSFERSPKRMSIHTLALSGCQEITHAFLPGLFKHKDLRILKLGRTNSLVTSDILISLLKNLPKLQVLDITRCPKIPKDIKSIPGITFLLNNTLISTL